MPASTHHPHRPHRPQSAASAAPLHDANGPLAELFAVNSSFSSAPGGSDHTPGNPFGTPPPLALGGMGATGFTDPPGPVPSQHSPQLPPMPSAAPSGLAPLAGPSTNVREVMCVVLVCGYLLEWRCCCVDCIKLYRINANVFRLLFVDALSYCVRAPLLFQHLPFIS